MKKSTWKSGSLTFAWYGVMFMWGLNFTTASRATWLNILWEDHKKGGACARKRMLRKYTNFGLWLPNMWFSEYKLSVEVADFYSVHVNLQISSNKCMRKLLGNNNIPQQISCLKPHKFWKDYQKLHYHHSHTNCRQKVIHQTRMSNH